MERTGICLVCWEVGVNTMDDEEFICDRCTKSKQEPCLQCGKKGKYLSEGLCPDCQE